MNYADNERQEMQKVIREHRTDIKAEFQKGIDKFKNLCQIIKEAGYPPKEAWDCIKEELGMKECYYSDGNKVLS